MDNIDVSVVIPFYSHVDWLEEAVESVLHQTFRGFEIIVVNDGSPEDMEAFLHKYQPFIRYILKENGGPATARNVGIDEAKGKYIAFLDSDDIWLPDKLKIQFERMEASECIWSYTSYRTFGDGKPVAYNMTKTDKDEIQRYNKPSIALPSVMVRTDFLKSHPGCRFNSAMRFGEDSYMWLKINADNSILAIHECLLKVRMRGGNASKRAKVQLRARGQIWKLRKEEKSELIDKYSISFAHKLASELCIMGDAIVSFFERRNMPEKVQEVIAKFLFVVPWAIFKMDRVISG